LHLLKGQAVRFGGSEEFRNVNFAWKKQPPKDPSAVFWGCVYWNEVCQARRTFAGARKSEAGLVVKFQEKQRMALAGDGRTASCEKKCLYLEKAVGVPPLLSIFSTVLGSNLLIVYIMACRYYAKTVRPWGFRSSRSCSLILLLVKTCTPTCFPRGSL